MRRTPAALFIGLVLMVVGLTGCYEDPSVTLYEPHEYKGTQDPLLSKTSGESLDETLAERFSSVQTDR